MVDHVTFGKSDNDLSHSMHTTDKRIASWSERANVYSTKNTWLAQAIKRRDKTHPGDPEDQ